MVKTIGIVGGGFVGHATARCFMEWAEVKVFDIDLTKATHPLTVEELISCELIFICLPTPSLPSGRCDAHVIDDWFHDWIEADERVKELNFVIKSTVPIGFTRQLRERRCLKSICHSPEFLTARCAVTDVQVPARNIIGETTWSPGAQKLYGLYQDRFTGVPIILMNSDESEAVKLMLNSFFAVKVGFFNEAREMADRLKLRWEIIMAGIMSDGRVAHSHTKVPGPDGTFGFGGACLPKDLSNLIHCINDAGAPSHITSAASFRNSYDRRRVITVKGPEITIE